jgi:hypothetical protein
VRPERRNGADPILGLIARDEHNVSEPFGAHDTLLTGRGRVGKHVPQRRKLASGKFKRWPVGDVGDEKSAGAQ